jgi:hypothetical protein
VGKDIELTDLDIWICGVCGNKNEIYLSNCKDCGKEYTHNNDNEKISEKSDLIEDNDVSNTGKSIEEKIKNLIYVLFNMIYLIPGTLAAMSYLGLAESWPDFFFYILIRPFYIFYGMGYTFTILIHPVIILIIFIIVSLNEKKFKIKHFIIFCWSLLIASIYIIGIWIMGCFLIEV